LKLAVGALLLTFVTAVTAGFFVYQFMFTLTEKMKTAFPPQSLQLDPVNINNTCMTLSVRNFASVNVQITGVYINGKANSLTESVFVSPNSVRTIHLHGTYVEGETYTLKITSSLGPPIDSAVRYD
jgi:P pilus assembly chaperone PapD